jgi:hypothetical protein
MPIIHFMGYVEPRETYVNAENLTIITERDVDTGRIITYTLAILDSVVSVECDVDQFNPEDMSRYYTRALELSRTFVNLISFKQGWGFFVHLDTFIDPDGKEHKLSNQATYLSGIVDSYDLHDFDDMYQRIGCDIDISLAFNDLNDALARPRIASINCARVLDTVKKRLAPGVKNERAAWRIVQENLNTDEIYLQYISDHSKLSRHGQHTYLSTEETMELLRRTWIIFNRFLHYLIHYSSPLPIGRFPHLTSPTPQS